MTVGRPNEENSRLTLNERKQKAKVKGTSRMRGDAGGEMKGRIGRNAGRKKARGRRN